MGTHSGRKSTGWWWSLLTANMGRFALGSLLCGACPLQGQPAPPIAPPQAASAPAAPVRLRVVGGLDGLSQYLHHEQPFWTRELAARSKGRVQAEIVPFDRAGIRAQDGLRLIQLGIVPFGTTLLSQVAAHAPELSAPDLAGLNSDMAAVRRAVTAFRPLLQRTLKERYGVELLAVYAYPAQVLFCKRPLTQLADLKGRRVRTSSASQSDLVEALGSTPVLTAFAEIMPYMRGGNIDCAITGTMSGNTIGLHEITRDLYAMPLNWGLSVFAAHAASWSALPQDVQALLREELPRLESAIWAESEKETGDGVDCNTGSPRCTDSRRGKMVAVPISERDEQLRREVFSSTVLARWIQRCGPVCARTWEQTLAPVTGINAGGK